MKNTYCQLPGERRESGQPVPQLCHSRATVANFKTVKCAETLRGPQEPARGGGLNVSITIAESCGFGRARPLGAEEKKILRLSLWLDDLQTASKPAAECRPGHAQYFWNVIDGRYIPSTESSET